LRELDGHDHIWPESIQEGRRPEKPGMVTEDLAHHRGYSFQGTTCVASCGYFVAHAAPAVHSLSMYSVTAFGLSDRSEMDRQKS
jgi:hypothetical protein